MKREQVGQTKRYCVHDISQKGVSGEEEEKRREKKRNNVNRQTGGEREKGMQLILIVAT